MGDRITVDAETCSACKRSKPRTEFYDSELCRGKRCKVCFRARVDATNKQNGRQSTSLSVQEVTWLQTLFRALPSSDLRDLAKRPEYVKFASKIATMAARTASRKVSNG